MLGSLLCYGFFFLGLDLTSQHILTTLTTTLCSQYIFDRYYLGQKFEYKSGLITGLSLSLLLRSNFFYFSALAAFLAIGSKFIIRVNGKHVFNPANFGIITLALLCEEAWLSPAQWGSTTLLAFYLICCGMLVTTKAARIDLCLVFFASYAGLLFQRALYLGDPLSIPLHQLQSGALLIFSCFMITDPRVTPDARLPRLLFGVAVALLAYYLRFKLYWNNTPLYALYFLSPLVPILDVLFKADRFEWLKESISQKNMKLIKETT